MKLASGLLLIVAILVFLSGVLFAFIAITSGKDYIGNGLMTFGACTIIAIFAYGVSELFDAVRSIRDDARRSADALETLAQRQRQRNEQRQPAP